MVEALAPRRVATLRPPGANATGAVTRTRTTPAASTRSTTAPCARTSAPVICQDATGLPPPLLPAATWSHSSTPPRVVVQNEAPPGRA